MKINMGEYLKTIVSSVVAVSILSAILPKDGFFKYTNLLSGLIVMAIIISPVLKSNDDFLKTDFDVERIEIETNTYLMEEYEKELSENIKNMLKEKTNINFKVLVFAEKTNDTIEIKEIKISPYATSYSDAVAEYLGIDSRRITEK